MQKYVAIYRVQVLNSLAYPMNFFGRGLMIVLFLWIFFQLWSTVYISSGQSIISGLTLRDTLWYLCMTEVLELGRPRLAQQVAAAVKDGSIAYLLNKPYDFLLYQLSMGLGEGTLRLGMNVVLGGAVTWAMVGAPPDVRSWPGTLVVFCGAWLLHFWVNALIGLAAFVFEEVTPFEWIYQKMVFVLGGMLIPLNFYPAWLQKLAHMLPFSSMMYAPAHLFVQYSGRELVRTLGMQAVWLLLLGGAATAAYRAGLQRLAINGG